MEVPKTEHGAEQRRDSALHGPTAATKPGDGLQEPTRTKDSPLWRAFRPPAERTFESPLRSLRLGSTYSAALSGAGRKVMALSRGCNPHVRKLREMRDGTSFAQPAGGDHT